MKITNIKSFLFHPSSEKGWMVQNIQKHWLFVKVETDEGIAGWGESFTLKDRERSIVQHISELVPYLIGRDPNQIKHFTHMIYDKFAERRGGPDLYCAMSGIEQALWDILGKRLHSPVYDLLGGPCHEKIRVYANGWSRGAKTPQEFAERALEVVERGFTAIKFYPASFLTSKNEREMERAAVENMRAVREAVGENIDILVDAWRLPDPAQAIRMAKRLEEFNLFWYEEPIPSENINVLAEVRQAIPMPIVTGECLYTKFEFREVLEKRAADILNPDVGSCGGILALKEIAAMAEPYYVKVSPHNFNSTTIALAATIQVSATLPNFLIAEYFVNFEEAGNSIVQNPFKVDEGYIKLPTQPGLGLELDEAVLRKHPFQEFPPREW
jgi:galactonate dehydratase